MDMLLKEENGHFKLFRGCDKIKKNEAITYHLNKRGWDLSAQSKTHTQNQSGNFTLARNAFFHSYKLYKNGIMCLSNFFVPRLT